MDAFEKIAERKIQEAIRNGEFANLRNSGKPIDLDEDCLIPQELRMAYRVLKNAGCVPPELEIRNEIISLRSMVNSLDDDKERMKKIRELNFRLLKLNELRKRPLEIEDFPEYQDKFYRKFIP
jgi:hypothetical protein